MTAILGISAFYHDSAAALVVDGQVVAGAQEERFSRRKHDASFPRRAIAYCLREAGDAAESLDYVAFYEKPLRKFDRLLETWLAMAPRGLASFRHAAPEWIQRKLWIRRALRRELHDVYGKRPVFADHHLSHAASAFFPSPFDEAAVLTVDGVGEWATACFGVGRGNRITLSHELRFPHSLGLLYSAFTHFCGFRVNSGEYKLMGLAPFGQPKYVDLILRELVDLRPDGSFRLDQSYFRYCQGLTMTSPRFERLFGGPPRRPESPLTEREMDLAASAQVVTEEILLRMARHVHQQTGQRHLCLAGGVALNCVANTRLLNEGPFDDLWIQPAAGDAGGALGAAWLAWHQLLNRPRTAPTPDSQRASWLGPQWSDDQVRQCLDQADVVYEYLPDDVDLCDRVAQLLAAGGVVGWLHGRMEFGPRALGARSILADARRADMQSIINHKIKFRESFRPLAPAVLAERAAEFFDLGPRGGSSPYMLFVAPIHPDRRRKVEKKPGDLDQLSEPRSDTPAVTHVDYSARPQTVDQRHGRFYLLLKRFEALTGSPMLVNTSFNVRGEPIVCSPQDALQCFLSTDLDVLVMEHCLLQRERQQAARRYMEQAPTPFPLD